MSRTWLTVDTDDRHHRPAVQGHPRRSEDPDGAGVERVPTEAWLQACSNLAAWLDRQQAAVTLFVIGDQLTHPTSRQALQELARQPGVTVGCHGFHHRAWGAWPMDVAGFAGTLDASMASLQDAFGDRVRPWFRAPSGYVAPWMAAVLAEKGFTVDSSVNPSALVRRKSGPGRSWKAVQEAMAQAGLVERPWMTRFGLPTCGPALHLPVLRQNARRAWSKVPAPLLPGEEGLVEQEGAITTLYWHLDDHAKKGGRWAPPLT